jgi:hypothetical protein
MKRFCSLVNVLSIIILIVSCKQVTDVSDSASDNLVLEKQYRFKYEFICKPPTYQQSMMLTCFDNKVFVYGCYGLMIYDTTAKSWQKTNFPIDTMNGRWDGALARHNNDLFVFGAPGFMRPKFFNVMKMDLISLQNAMLEAPLPFQKYEPYPAYAQTENTIMIIYPRVDSIYLFDFTTEKGKCVAKNELKVGTNTPYDIVPYAFGKHGNYLYVYKKDSFQLKRINLSTYQWETIEIPRNVLRYKLENMVGASGAVFDGFLLLFKGNPIDAICYEIETNTWGNVNYDGSSVPFFESRHTNEKEFFYLDHYNDEVWRATRVK